MSFDRSVAQIVVRRPGLIYAGIAALALVSAVLLLCCLHLDSEVLNLLPASFDSVEALKTYNKDFTQARELTIALLDEDHSADLDGFTEYFGDALRKEPWVVRVMDRSPMENPDGIQDIQTIALPLLFGLPSADFSKAAALLQPANIQARLHKLRSEIEAGSPRAEMELNFDPLGIVTRALKPLAGSFSTDQNRPLSSPDGTLRLVFVVIKQDDLGAHACQAVMRRVEDFKNRVRAGWQQGKAPRILVTGRTAYVGELSEYMRQDIIWTLFGSVVLVSAVFYAGFRRIRPLLAIMHVLLLCCIVSVAAGGVIFHEMNMITIGFCSILIGLGVDFGMLLYGSYQSHFNAGLNQEESVAGAIRQLGKGVFFGSLTTGAAFLCLALSGCAGFAQLGVLIAIGILLAGGFMMTIFFVFLGKNHVPSKEDWFFRMTARYVHFVFRRPRQLLCATGVLLGALSLFACLPIGRLAIEANPRSLEPKESKAGYALRTITEKMPSAGVEPVIAFVSGKDAEEFHDRWSRIWTHWTALAKEGKIKSFTSPAAFAVSPRQAAENVKALSGLDLAASREALQKALAAEGFSAKSFQNAVSLLDQLQAIARGDDRLLDWRKTLSPNSSWWFLLERFFSTTPNLAAAYVLPLKTISSLAEKDSLTRDLATDGIPIRLSGWSYTMADLVPWAKHTLAKLSIVMVAFNVLLLAFLYRKPWPLLILMFSLALSIGAMLACLKLGVMAASLPAAATFPWLKALSIPLNLFNVLAFPLVLGVGVDYGIYILLGMRRQEAREHALATILKPVLMAGLTAVAGFGSLGLAHNPSLSGLGIVCALGVAWSLFATLFFILPAYVLRGHE